MTPCKPSSLKPFMFEGATPIRVVLGDDGKPRFVAKDVAEALGYAWNGTSRIAHVPEQWRGVTSVVTPSGEQEMATLTDQGLYFFLGRSDKPKALPFQMWIAGEVVPSIIETGAYSVTPEVPADVGALVAMPKSGLLRLAADLADKLEAQERQLVAQKPAVEFLDRFVEAKSTKGLREVAKVLGLKEKDFVARLVEDGVMFRQSGRLLPSAEYQHRGYFEVKTGETRGYVYAQVRFTPAGIAWAAKRYAIPGESGPMSDT